MYNIRILKEFWHDLKDYNSKSKAEYSSPWAVESSWTLFIYQERIQKRRAQTQNSQGGGGGGICAPKEVLSVFFFSNVSNIADEREGQDLAGPSSKPSLVYHLIYFSIFLAFL